MVARAEVAVSRSADPAVRLPVPSTDANLVQTFREEIRRRFGIPASASLLEEHSLIRRRQVLGQRHHVIDIDPRSAAE